LKAMKKVISLIDGFNLYHAIHDIHDCRKYKWLNLKKLTQCFMQRNEELTEVTYFSAYATWKVDKVARHKIYVSALKAAGVKTVLSEFRIVDKFCTLCKKWYKTHEEKRTDVQIAISLFKGAINDVYDKAIIISADSDLAPSIEAVKSVFPHKHIHLVIPIQRRAEFLKQVADSYSKIKRKHLASSQFEDTVDLGDGQILKRPSEWSR